MRAKTPCFRILLWVASLLTAAGLVSAASPQDSASELLKTADEIISRVAALRGLAPRAPIQKGVKSREEIAQFLNSHVKENVDDGQLRGEGEMLRKLGLIPASMDFKDFTLKLLTEQVGGYYDPDKKTFFIAAWLPLDQQKPVMVHELTHALQDQYFDIGKYQKEEKKSENDDRSLARQAIFEGDAMAVMIDFMLEPVGKNFTQLPNLVTVMRQQFSATEAQFDVFKEAPMFLKEELLFPYGYGAAFLQKLRSAQPWSAVNRIYSDLPASTEQVMHPEKYLEGRDDPKPVDLGNPVPAMGAGWKTAFRNVLGEFSIYLMLKAFIPEETAQTASAGWGGDQILLVQDTNGRNALFFSSIWDTPEDADQFFKAMDDWFKVRFPEIKRTAESEGLVRMSGADGFSQLRRDGKKVRFILGMPEAQSGAFTAW